MGVELVLAGLVVGTLIGATGMGAGSLMAPVLITLFGSSAVGAVGTDLLYSATTKAVGGWRHLSLNTVNKELAWWMAAGSVPASLAGVVTLHELIGSSGSSVQDHLKLAIGAALLLVAFVVLVRTFSDIGLVPRLGGHLTARSTAPTRSSPSSSGCCSATCSGSRRSGPAPSSASP